MSAVAIYHLALDLQRWNLVSWVFVAWFYGHISMTSCTSGGLVITRTTVKSENYFLSLAAWFELCDAAGTRVHFNARLAGLARCQCVLMVSRFLLKNEKLMSSHDGWNSSSKILSLSLLPTVIVPNLPDFSRHRVGHNKQYQSKFHHDRHFGPFFEDPTNSSTGTLQVAFHQGTEAHLNCRVGMLKDKTVRKTSWILKMCEWGLVEVPVHGNLLH